MRQILLGLGVALSFLPALAADPQPKPEPTRIVIECEDMQGVAQDKAAPGEVPQEVLGEQDADHVVLVRTDHRVARVPGT